MEVGKIQGTKSNLKYTGEMTRNPKAQGVTGGIKQFTGGMRFWTTGGTRGIRGK
jgi:hypothetical protein